MNDMEVNERIEAVDNQVGTDTDNIDYISAISEIKKNSVSKEAYQKLKDENKKLLDSLINGNQVELPPQKPSVNVNELRKKLFNGDSLSNLEYCNTALELRDALLESGERDPFLPYGKNISPTEEDIIKADKVATVMRECVEYADGDSEVFTNELQRRMIDAMPIRRNSVRR